jgi:hypothetical protein
MIKFKKIRNEVAFKYAAEAVKMLMVILAAIWVDRLYDLLISTKYDSFAQMKALFWITIIHDFVQVLGYFYVIAYIAIAVNASINGLFVKIRR